MTAIPLDIEQQQHWRDKGYLHLKNVLSPQEITTALQAIDALMAFEHSQADNTEFCHGRKYYNILNVFENTGDLDFLLDHPTVFDIVTFLMGPYLQILGCDVFIRHPSHETNGVAKFHTDGGPASQQILPHGDNLPLQFKAQFVLTDMSKEYSGNLTVIPGSHVQRVNYHNSFCVIPECNKYVEKGMMPPDAVQIVAKPGDVLIHHWSLWHAVSPNTSEQSRKSVSVRYGQMWLKPFYRAVSQEILQRLTIRQRRLLGDFGANTGLDVSYRPPEDHLQIILGDKIKSYGWEHRS